MKLTRNSLASAAGVAAVLAMVHVGQALAGPDEDYAEGSQHYAVGDLFGAMPLLRRAADAGHAAAQVALGEILDQADLNQEALEYYRKAAAQGSADGQFALGVMLASDEAGPKNLPEARKFIFAACKQEHKLAINELASAYIDGGLGISESDRQGAEALRWISISANNNHLAAMEKLATAYRNGELGLSIDIATANQWAEKARKVRGDPPDRRNKRSKKQ